MDLNEQMQYMIDHYDEQTYPQFAEKFGVKYVTIAKRVERLKKRGLLPNENKRIPGSTDYEALRAHGAAKKAQRDLWKKKTEEVSSAR